MNQFSSLRLVFGLAASALAITAQTSTHDDPIIVKGGSVYVQFGNRTKALSGSGLWEQQSGNRWLYHQHTHMADSGPGVRQIQSLFVPANASPAAKSTVQHGSPLNLGAQKQLKIAIYLKGKATATSTAVALPGAGPQLILSAVQVATPCCMHPAPVAINAAVDQCGPGVPHPAVNSNSKDFQWSWVVSSDRKLVDKGVIAASRRQEKMRNMQYVHPDYAEVEVDYWRVLQGDAELFTSRDNTTRRSKMRGCPAIEVCAIEGSPLCDLTEFTCPNKYVGSGGTSLPHDVSKDKILKQN